MVTRTKRLLNSGATRVSISCPMAVADTSAGACADIFAGRRKWPSRPERTWRPRAGCTKFPSGTPASDGSFERRVPIRVGLAHAVAHAAHGVNELYGKWFVDLFTQVT